MRLSISSAVDEQLLEAVRKAERSASRLGRPVLLTCLAELSECPPLLSFLRSHSERGAATLYFSTPGRELRLAGAGRAASVRPAGGDRFLRAGSGWRRLLEGHISVVSGKAPPLAAPIALGGFSFFDRPARGDWGAWSPFAEGLLAVPEECLIEYGGACWRARQALVSPGADPKAALASLSAPGSDREKVAPEGGPRPQQPAVDEPEQYRRIVAAAVEAIRGGEFSKVVLARSTFVPGLFSASDVLEQLDKAHPQAYVYAFDFGEAAFLGATPERLLSLRKRVLTTMALAGSAPRGETPEEDEALGAKLLRSTKNQGEHGIVVDYLVEALTPVCKAIETAAEPVLLKMPNVQHLLTPIQGRLDADLGLLELLGRVHPTPAVGGFPKERALEYLRSHEGIERGWYAGPVGWIDANGDGEFAVALRSALLARGGATLFAGCGIVASSDPDEELLEAGLKARPILQALERSTP